MLCRGLSLVPRACRILLVALLLIFVFALPVLAIGNPTSISMGDLYAFRNVLVSGDQLYFVRYTVNYAVSPSELPSTIYMMAIYSVDGLTPLFTRPLNYYQENIISIYLTPAQALTWGNAYIVRIMGNPGVFPILTEGVNQISRTLAPGDFHEASDLGSTMLAQAQILQTDWSITLLSSGLLNSTGATYFNSAVPGLNNMVPSIYVTTLSVFGSPSPATNTTYAYTDRAGTPWHEAINGTASIFGASFGGMGFFMSAVMGLMVGGIVYASTKRPDFSLVFTVSTIGILGYIGTGSETWMAFLWVVLILGILFGIIYIGRNFPF